jgi:anti-sigma28 factor (negative regulator of flagellin synthesis)
MEDSKGLKKFPEELEMAPKKRSLTSVTLQWLAERVRKTERIKEELQAGHYKVSSEQIAASIVNDDDGVEGGVPVKDVKEG